MVIFYIVWAVWFISEIILNRFMRSSEADKKDQDKGSLRIIWRTIGVAMTLSILAANFIVVPIWMSDVPRYVGLGILLAGMGIRFAAIWSLGKMFTVDVTIRENHQIKQNGMYKYVRHPSYVGMLLTFYGFALSLDNWISLIIIVVPVTYVLLFRIKIEEAMLIEQFGDVYKEYQKRSWRLIPWLFGFALFLVNGCSSNGSLKYDDVSRVENGKAVSVMLTTYSTTLIANGKDETALRICLTDSLSREITGRNDSIRIYVTGGGTVTDKKGGKLTFQKDTAGIDYAICTLTNGVCQLKFIAGNKPGKVKVEARSGKLWPGSHEIHTIPADVVLMSPSPDQLAPTTKSIDRMIGADISFLPQLEDRGMKFYEDGAEKDAVLLLRDNGFNFIRLRIFVNPENEKGYAPEIGYCGLRYTLGMAKRIKGAGMKFLLDFHYSDYWADPQQQNKPKAWADLDFHTLKDSVRAYTAMVLRALYAQGTLPDLVQIGNEINHGLLWPDGHISHPDQLAELLQMGVSGVEDVNPDLPVMMHIALGGQNDEARFWLDNMLARGLKFDIIGLSYYPRWHGTLEDLDHNLNDLIKRYHKPVNVVEYSDFKKEVHDIVFNLPDQMGKGAAIWEPLGWRSRLFNRDDSITELFSVYRDLKKEYLEE